MSYEPTKGDGVLPIKIRDNCKVCFENLPHDLTKSEAEKIARVIESFAEPTPNKE